MPACLTLHELWGWVTITSRRPPQLGNRHRNRYPMSEIRIRETNYNGPNISEPNSDAPRYIANSVQVNIPQTEIINVMEAYNEDTQNTPIYSHFRICYYEEVASVFVNWVAKKYPQYCNQMLSNILRSQMR